MDDPIVQSISEYEPQQPPVTVGVPEDDDQTEVQAIRSLLWGSQISDAVFARWAQGQWNVVAFYCAIVVIIFLPVSLPRFPVQRRWT